MREFFDERGKTFLKPWSKFKSHKEILDKFNSIKEKKSLRGKLTNTEENTNNQSQKINDKLRKKVYNSYHRARPAVSSM